MSGKRRKRKFSPSGKPESILHSPHPLLEKASDGYQNSLAGLGDASPLLSGGTFIKSGLSSNLELLMTLYRDSWIAKRIIDMPSEDMTRSWIRIIVCPCIMRWICRQKKVQESGSITAGCCALSGGSCRIWKQSTKTTGVLPSWSISGDRRFTER